MELQKAEIRCNKLLLQFKIDKKIDEKDKIVFKCRKTGGYAENEYEYAIDEISCSDKNYTAAASIDLAEINYNGLYWDILFKYAGKNKYESLILDDEKCKEVQRNAKRTEYWINDKESVRLYPTKDGKLFIKRVLDGVVYQKFDANAPAVEEYVINPNVKPQGARYIDVKEVSGDKMVFSLIDSEDIAGAVSCIVLVSDKDEKKQVISIEKDNDNNILNLENVNYNQEENYRVYMAAQKGGFYYYFRIRAKRIVKTDAEPSAIYYDSDRYIASYSIGDLQALLYIGATNDGLNLIFGDKAFCEQKKKGMPRITSENMNESYPFGFTMVIAVYNAEAYLGETIESLLLQDIGFKKNIQIVLVDDGSTDNSLEICNYYADRYPGNIVVKHKENGGVSSTRNLGLQYAEGKYINFMDSDDKLSENTCSSVWKFFEANYEKIDVVSIPINQFGAITGPHWQ
ncbi:MAG: glycosyltransferase family 2 protein, partial [Coprococcus sp.]